MASPEARVGRIGSGAVLHGNMHKLCAVTGGREQESRIDTGLPDVMQRSSALAAVAISCRYFFESIFAERGVVFGDPDPNGDENMRVVCEVFYDILHPGLGDDVLRAIVPSLCLESIFLQHVLDPLIYKVQFFTLKATAFHKFPENADVGSLLNQEEQFQ